MATIKDIARELKLAVSTVSMALNNHPSIKSETRERVINQANKMGYIRNGVAVDLQRKKTKIILLIITDASRSYYSRVIKTVQEEIAIHGYDLIIITTGGSSNAAERFISEHRADGAIIYTNQISEEFIRRYARDNFPVLLLGTYIDYKNIYCTNKLEKEDGTAIAAVEYLIANGHKRIAFVKGSSATRGTPRRYYTYKEVLKRNNIAYDANIIFDSHENTFDAGYTIAHQIKKKIDKIDAVYFSSDDIAIGALRYFSENNIRIPEDLSIIGNNDLPEAALVSPALTSVGYNEEESLPEGVALLINAIENGPTEYDVTKFRKKIKVVERSTVKKR